MAILIRLSELCHFASQSHHSSFRWKMTPMLGLEPKPFWALHALQKPPCSLRSVFQNPSASLNKDISFCTSFLFLTIWYRNSGAKCCPNSLNHVKPTKNWFPLSAPPTPFRLGLVPSVAKGHAKPRYTHATPRKRQIPLKLAVPEPFARYRQASQTVKRQNFFSHLNYGKPCSE